MVAIQTGGHSSIGSRTDAFLSLRCPLVTEWSAGDIAGKPMDDRVEAFLADVLALEGEEASAIREAVRVALTDCEQVFQAQEVNKRMKERAAHACRALCRARVVEEMRLRKGTTTAEHLKVVLSVIDGPRFP
jgi:hypothetical protein